MPGSPRAARTGRRGARPGGRVFAAAVIFADVCAVLVTVGLTGQPADAVAVVVPALVALNAGAGHYRVRLKLSALDEAPALVVRAVTVCGLALALIPITGWRSLIAVDPAQSASAVLVLCGSLLAGRTAAYALVHNRRRRRRPVRRTLVVGTGAVADRVSDALLATPDYGLYPVGVLDSVGPIEDRARFPLLGRPDELARTIVEHDIHHVVLTFGAFDDGELTDAVRTISGLHCEIFVVPRLFELTAADGYRVQDVAGIPMVRVPPGARRSSAWLAKRALDVVCSAVGLIVASPLLAACALAVRLETGPGVLFRQDRVGLGGQYFTLLKFRTLRPVDDAESSTRWNIALDDRLGPVGRFLRRTSLDELPQLWNVLRGHMSLVGPRPERPYFVDRFEEEFDGYSARHRVPVGITGLAQIHGLRGDTSIAERVRFDNRYIDSWSLWRDVKILLRTVMAMRRGE